MAEITVAVPVYNREVYLAATLDSILGTVNADYRVVIVDDHSRDDSFQIAQAYVTRDRRVSAVRNNENLGLTRNWNRCLGLADGQWVVIVPSDDLIDANYLSIVMAAIRRSPNVGFVAANCRYIDGDGHVIDTGRPEAERLLAAGDDGVLHLLRHGFPHVASVVFSKTALDAVGGYDPVIWHGPDGELDARIAQRFGYLHLGGVYTSFRRHGGNAGFLEFFREGYLETERLKTRRVYEHLSPDALRALGIADLESFVRRGSAAKALLGAQVAFSYRRPQSAVRYLRAARILDPGVAKSPRFWALSGMRFAPRLAGAILRVRYGVHDSDLRQAGQEFR